MRAADTPSSLYAQPPQLGGHQRFKQRVLVSCPRSLWTKRRAGRGAPPRNTLSRNPHLALVRSHESEARASGNAQKPRFRGGAPRPARRFVHKLLGQDTSLSPVGRGLQESILSSC